MHSLGMMAGVACVLAWMYLLLAHGRFWMVQRAGAGIAPLADTGLIAVIIPARNEADVIAKSVTSLLQQSYAGSTHIFVVDDASADNTAAAAQEAARGLRRAEALTVVVGQPLPPGWSGKLWAVQQAIERALPLQPRFFLLTDADIQHSPENVATLVGVVERGGYDLASFMVKLHCHSVAEKLLIPAFVFFFFLLCPPEWISDPRRDTAGAAGGCILVRPAVLERVGGIAAMRGEIIDDCALAAAVKRTRGKVWLGLTQETCSLREYGSFTEIERMVARTAFNQLRHSALLLMAAMAGLTVIYLLPLALLFSGAPSLMATGTVGCCLMTIAYLPMVRFYRLNVLWALTLPVSAAFYMWATLHSAVKYWSGQGGEWKGRVQDIISHR
jgi:hopene-associated glycosyltransferase HpnB